MPALKRRLLQRLVLVLTYVHGEERRGRPEMFIGLDRHGTDFSASWLTTIANVMRVASRANARGLETQKDMKGATDALQRGGSCRGYRGETARTRDMLDFLAIHLGGYMKYGDKLYNREAFKTRIHPKTKIRFVQNTLGFIASGRSGLHLESRKKTLCLVSLCFRCTPSYNTERRSLEAVFMQTAVTALRLSCQTVVAGVMRFVAKEDSDAARRAGFDAWFPVDHSNITERPSNWTGFWTKPSKRHAWQTVAQLADRLRNIRRSSEGNDNDAFIFFDTTQVQATKRYDLMLWSEQDMLILPRHSAFSLMAAGRRFCRNRFAVVQPWRAHAIPKTVVNTEATLHTVHTYSQFDKASCCFLFRDRSRLGPAGESEVVPPIPAASPDLAFLEINGATKNTAGGVILGLAGNNDCRQRVLYYPCWLYSSTGTSHCPCSKLKLTPEAKQARLENLSFPPTKGGAASAFLGCHS